MNTDTDVLFISHGGGPMPLLGDPGHREMVDRLTELAATLRKPSAILVICAHWEEAVPTITSGATLRLSMITMAFHRRPTRSSIPARGSRR